MSARRSPSAKMPFIIREAASGDRSELQLPPLRAAQGDMYARS